MVLRVPRTGRFPGKALEASLVLGVALRWTGRGKRCAGQWFKRTGKGGALSHFPAKAAPRVFKVLTPNYT